MSELNIGVIFAGGVGSRMHSKERPKQFLEIYNKPIIVHTIEYFQNCDLIDSIVVVCVEDWIEYFKSLVYKYRLDKIKKLFQEGKLVNYQFIMDYAPLKKFLITPLKISC
ncbi:2-C-methyl-D-erythritol 4-phosphate cytidylyltransferase [Ruminococcus sp. SR1/5]|uniref:IspD/TarI family cytidylyltransferase n=1 Tax=Ruminococcus sp. SR1/5 TaxID=657323 RepID=UPI0001CD5872|nr:2-C-methyl-D-erythritol 4-phosphate cytidylyltransferase [Ruminococcus sp. SR1/5]CBL21496.1 4-diphosphocytidyl-2-methyl-D-erithritol synthase [Ruminococcus sp. SR1/5]